MIFTLSGLALGFAWESTKYIGSKLFEYTISKGWNYFFRNKKKITEKPYDLPTDIP